MLLVEAQAILVMQVLPALLVILVLQALPQQPEAPVMLEELVQQVLVATQV